MNPTESISLNCELSEISLRHQIRLCSDIKLKRQNCASCILWQFKHIIFEYTVHKKFLLLFFQCVQFLFHGRSGSAALWITVLFCHSFCKTCQVLCICLAGVYFHIFFKHCSLFSLSEILPVFVLEIFLPARPLLLQHAQLFLPSAAPLPVPMRSLLLCTFTLPCPGLTPLHAVASSFRTIIWYSHDYFVLDELIFQLNWIHMNWPM